jgi:hypothetical protein
MNEQRLRQTGNAHQQGMSTGEDADEQFLDDFILTNDDLGEFGTDFSVKHAQFINGGDIGFCISGIGWGNFRHEIKLSWGDGNVSFAGREDFRCDSLLCRGQLWKFLSHARE